MFFPMNLPHELIQSGCFCYWKYENRSGKQTKVPYNPQTDEMARSNDKNAVKHTESMLQKSQTMPN